MKILITGASGFIGQNLISNLLKKNHKVSIITRKLSNVKKFKWSSKVEIFEKNLNFLNKKDYHKFSSNDVVIHLAWDGLPNYNDKIHFENYKISLDFIKKIIDLGIKHLIITGTCFEYGLQNGCLKEHGKTNPKNNYGLAKENLRREIFTYSKKKKIIIKWARLFYLYGKGQNKKSLIGQLEEKIRNKEKNFFMSKGDQLRDYMNIKDVCKRICKLVENDYINGVVNICSNKPITVENLVLKYLKNKKKNIKLIKGYYKYNSYEPMNFWGHSKYFDSKGNIKKKYENIHIKPN
jgi:dTDP-6-deoxy-L-talose 4-dehydrogenase (NAD+)